jgi:hypothetical protein
LPADWNTNNDMVRLRYRPADPKTGSPSMILKVQRDTTSPNSVIASWEPVSSSSSATVTFNETNEWLFALEDFVNLESWHVAATRSGGSPIPPALHYKSLATFLSTFVSTVWWPHHHHEALNTTSTTTMESDTGSTPYIDYTMLSGPPNNTAVPSNPRATTTTTTVAQQVLLEHDHQPPRWSSVDPADPLMVSSTRSSGRYYPAGPKQGDFSGDLRPTGLDPFPSSQGGVYHDPSILPGNLMGPNHPMFRGGGGGGVGGIGPLGGGDGTGGVLGMQPRFDPFGPPGGPTQHDQDQPPLDPDGFVVPGSGPLRRVPPGGTGNPNNDLQRFPPSLGSGSSGHNLYL